jgi:hypothetical protein
MRLSPSTTSATKFRFVARSKKVCSGVLIGRFRNRVTAAALPPACALTPCRELLSVVAGTLT